MKQTMLRWTGILTAAVVLTYAGTVANTEVKDFARWSMGFSGLCVLTVICGIFLTLISNRAFSSIVTATALATLMVSTVWSYILWSFLDGQIAYTDILMSNPLVTFKSVGMK